MMKPITIDLETMSIGDEEIANVFVVDKMPDTDKKIDEIATLLAEHLADKLNLGPTEESATYGDDEAKVFLGNGQLGLSRFGERYQVAVTYQVSCLENDLISISPVSDIETLKIGAAVKSLKAAGIEKDRIMVFKPESMVVNHKTPGTCSVALQYDGYNTKNLQLIRVIGVLKADKQ